MFGLSRLLELAGEISWRLNVRGGRSWLAHWPQKVRRAALGVEELEGRIVPTLLGQPLFPSDYPWNQNISSAPVAANSAAIIEHIGSSIKVHPDWGQDSASNGSNPLYGIPFNIVHGNSASVTQVQVRRRRIKTRFDAQGPPGFLRFGQALAHLFFADQFRQAFFYVGELFVDRAGRHRTIVKARWTALAFRPKN